MCIAKAYTQKEKAEIEKQNILYHLQGQYFMEALASTVGNMFKGKTAKKHEYPKKPFEIYKNENYSEDELQKQRELFVAKLLAMQTNFELNHKSSKS